MPTTSLTSFLPLFPFLYQFPLLLPFTGAPTFLIVLLHPTYHLFCLYPKFHQEDFGAAWLCTVPKTQAYSAALHSQSINSSKLISHSPEKHKDLTEHHTASAMPRGIGQVPPAGWQAPSQQSRCTGKKKSQKKTVRPEGHQHKGSSVLLLPSPGSHRLSLCPTECFRVFCTRFPFDSQQNCCPHLHARCAQTEAMSLHPPLPAATENPKSTQLSVTSPQSTRRCRQTATTQKHRSTNTPHLTFKMYQ